MTTGSNRSKLGLRGSTPRTKFIMVTRFIVLPRFIRDIFSKCTTSVAFSQEVLQNIERISKFSVHFDDFRKFLPPLSDSLKIVHNACRISFSFLHTRSNSFTSVFFNFYIFYKNKVAFSCKTRKFSCLSRFFRRILDRRLSSYYNKK